MNLDPEMLKTIEAVVGPVEGTMTPAQSLTWAKHMAAEADGEFNRALGDTAKFYFAPQYGQHWFANPRADDAEGQAFAAAMLARSANALKMFLSRDQTPHFVGFLQQNKLPGFAGDRLPEHAFPAANCWFEIAFVPGQYPAIVPLRDGIGMAQVRVANLAIHAIHDGAIDALTGEGPYKWAQILAFVTDATGHVHTFAGLIEYGQGGALMYPVANHKDAATAYSGLNPKPAIQRQPMGNVAQFVCGTLAHLISYYSVHGGINLDAPQVEETTNATDAA